MNQNRSPLIIEVFNILAMIYGTNSFVIFESFVSRIF